LINYGNEANNLYGGLFFFTAGLKSWLSGNSLFCRTIWTSPEGVRKISPGGMIKGNIRIEGF